MARAHGMPVDSYEVRLLLGADCDSSADTRPSLHMNSNSYFGRKWCGVSVLNSNSDSSSAVAPLCGVLAPSAFPDTSSTSQLLVLPYNFPLLLPLFKQAFEVAISQGGKARTSTSGVVVPPMISNPTTTLSNQWQMQLKGYLDGVPPYYFDSLYKVFQTLGIQVFISLLTGAATASTPHPDVSISRAVSKNLKSLFNSTCSELRVLERQLRSQSASSRVQVGLGEEQQACMAPGMGISQYEDFDTCSELSGFSSRSITISQDTDAGDISLAPYTPTHFTNNPSPMKTPDDNNDSHVKGSDDYKNAHCAELQKYLKGLCLPLREPSMSDSSLSVQNTSKGLAQSESSLLIPPPCHDLLYTWESMRSKLYGNKGGGVTVNGLFVAGLLSSTGGSVVRGRFLVLGCDCCKNVDDFYKL